MAHASDADTVLSQSRSVESAALSLLSDQYRLEEALFSPDADRVLVFLSVPHGKRVIIDQVNLKIDGKSVATYSYSGTELLSFQQRSVQLLYVGRMTPGKHLLRLDVKTSAGQVQPMKDYVLVKEGAPKFVDVQIAGYDFREVAVSDW